MQINSKPRRAAQHRYGAALAALGALLAPASALARADNLSLTALNASDLRLASIGYRLATANADRCAAPVMLTGLILHDLGQYASRERQAVAAHYGLGDGIGVVAVVPGSAAQQAGLRAGDEIMTIGAVDMRVAQAALPSVASYGRVENTVAMIRAGAAQGAARLKVKRGDETLDLALAGVSGCGGETVLAPSRVLNAWSDGTHVVVTTRLLAATASDDELAFVVAHEMSHNNLKHQERLGSAVNGLFAAFGRAASRIKETEIEADTSAIGLMATAGYRLDSAADFLKRIGRGRVLEIATTHPGTRRRVQIVTAAVQAVVRPAADPDIQLATVQAEPWSISVASTFAVSGWSGSFASTAPALSTDAGLWSFGYNKEHFWPTPATTTLPLVEESGTSAPVRGLALSTATSPSMPKPYWWSWPLARVAASPGSKTSSNAIALSDTDITDWSYPTTRWPQSSKSDVLLNPVVARIQALVGARTTALR